MRQLKDHKIAGLNECIDIRVLDEPGQGGACHVYEIVVEPYLGLIQPDGKPLKPEPSTIRFQNGPINEVGVNGISQESLLAVVIDRLRSFQAGPYACRENALALTKTEEALMWLKKRTMDRLARSVEGTSAK